VLSIGEFSKIYSVSAKTLRYYAEIGLILPSEINPEKGRDEKAITRTGKGPASTGMRHAFGEVSRKNQKRTFNGNQSANGFVSQQ